MGSIPEPTLEFSESQAGPAVKCFKLDLDETDNVQLPAPADCAQAMCVWFKADDLSRHKRTIHHTLESLLIANPHSTLQVVLEPTGDPHSLQPEFVEDVLAVCYRQPNYLDRYYSLNPQGMLGSKRVVIKLADKVDEVDEDWADSMLDSATLV